MTKVQRKTVKRLLTDYTWKRGAWQLAVLKGLERQVDNAPGKALTPSQLKALNVIEAQAKQQDRQLVQAEARRSRNERHQNRQLESLRMGR